tara:strand:+ start:378 stop:785 length:408 start_codon:yes stop_codon:yes gene_type:complete
MSGPNYDDYDADAEECINWQLNYLSQGRSRAVLIAWLTARPEDANLIVHDILKFLPTERKYLEKDQNPLGSVQKEEIYKMRQTGDFLGFGKIDGWDDFSVKQKINEIAKAFPQYIGNESGLENIVSEQKNKDTKE